MMNKKLKSFLAGFWELLVLFAYMKFYLMCMIGTMLSLLSAMWILANAGEDIAHLAKGFKWVGYLGTSYIAIIMADKIAKTFKKKEKKK